MNLSWEYGNSGIAEDEKVPVPEVQCVRHDSSSSRMAIVSDADEEDDAPNVRAEHTRFSDNDIEKSGSSSSHTSTTAMSSGLPAPHQVTPMVQDSQETLARTAVRDNQLGRDPTLPFYPLLSLTDDRKTPFTIQPREMRSQDSHPSNLVDEYAVKNESNPRHDFNACRNCKPEDAPRSKKEPTRTGRISENPIDSHLGRNPHKIEIADCHTRLQPSICISSNHHTSHQNNSNMYEHPHQLHLYQRNLIQPEHSQIPHKISSDELQTGSDSKSNTMPSKVAQCLPRQRSRAIAIKRSRPGEFLDRSDARGTFLDKEARRCDVELYDHATWRMYNRIIDHRRKNPSRTSNQEDRPQEQGDNRTRTNKGSQASHQASTSSSAHRSGMMVHPSSTMNGQRYFVPHNVPYMDDDSLSCDDDIFDFEL